MMIRPVVLGSWYMLRGIFVLILMGMESMTVVRSTHILAAKTRMETESTTVALATTFGFRIGWICPIQKWYTPMPIWSIAGIPIGLWITLKRLFLMKPL